MEKRTNILNIALWAVQVLLAATLVWAAYMKLLSPPETLAEMWPWTAGNAPLVKTTGVVDLLGGLGLVLPMLLKLWPKLTVVAAFGVIALMIAACIFHFSRGEGAQTPFNFMVMALAAFVAWGRSKRV